MCEPILAYRSKNGKIYATSKECDTATKAFEDEQLKNKITDIFCSVMRDPVKNSRVMYADNDHWIKSQQHNSDLYECTMNWRFIRDKLNEIET